MKNKIIGACLIGVGLLLSVFFWAPLAPNGETIFGASRFSPGGGSERSPGLWQLIGTVISPTNSSYSLSVPVSTASSTFTTALNVPYITDKQVYFSDRGTAKGSAGLTYVSSTYALEVGDGNTGYVSSTRLIVGPGTVGTGGIQFTGNGSGVTGFASETVNAIVVRSNGTNMWRFNANGHIEPVANNSRDIGTPSLGLRNFYVVGTSFLANVSSTGNVSSTAANFYAPNLNALGATGDFVCQNNTTGYLQVQLANCTVSSIRFKEHVESMSSSDMMAMARKLRAVSYDYKNGDKGMFGTSHDQGFIAEEVAMIDPYLVAWEEATPEALKEIKRLYPKAIMEREGKKFIPRTVDYMKISVILSGAIQDLDDRVSRLEAK